MRKVIKNIDCTGTSVTLALAGDEFLKLVNESDDEMWRINAKFIDNQFAAKKDFYFSHNPSTATGSFEQEVDYIKNTLKAKDFVEEGKYWKVIW